LLLSERLYFGSFIVLLPNGWSTDCIINSTEISNYDGTDSEITILKSADKNLWTKKSSCGEKGHQMFADYQIFDRFNDDDQDNFISKWIEYKYGIGEVAVDCESSSKSSICEEAKNIEPTNSQEPLFKNHNSYFPSEHNSFCNRKSPLDIVLGHEDFIKNEKSEMRKPPTFKYVKKAITRYMVLIDDSLYDERDSFAYLRDSFRKFIEKDLSHDSTELAIEMLSENSTKINFNYLRSADVREEILGNFWYTTASSNSPKCTVNLAISRSINLLKERKLHKGNAISIILVIGSGLQPRCNDEAMTRKIVSAAKDENIKIVTINYPKIATNRIPMDNLAIETGGKSFTILETKQNEQQSLLSTFFELTNILMHISHTYSTTTTQTPIEIYRKELIDTSREDNRQTFDSFFFDEAFENFNFFIYIYDRKERNIEKGMKLISPNNIEFSTLSELRAEYHQVQIVGNLSGSGR
jgi:hypothetical protein